MNGREAARSGELAQHFSNASCSTLGMVVAANQASSCTTWIEDVAEGREAVRGAGLEAAEGPGLEAAGRRRVGVAARAVGDGVAAETGAPRVRHPARFAPGTRAAAAEARRQREVELVDVDGNDLADAEDVVVTDALVEPVGLRRQVEYR